MKCWHAQKQMLMVGLALLSGLLLTVSLLGGMAIAQGPGGASEQTSSGDVGTARPLEVPARASGIGAMNADLRVTVKERDDRVEGTTSAPPGTTVTITVKRAGVSIASKTTSVWGEGSSNVYVADFFVNTQTDAISPGDEVEVATTELTTAVTVAGVGEMAIGNPGRVDGSAPPLNTVWIMVSQKVPNTCSTYDVPPAQTISSTAAGTYTAIFNWLWRGARISLSVTDSEGSGTTTYPSDVFVPVINVTKHNNAVDGFVKPLQVVTITLLDVVSSTLKTVTKTADKDGYFFDYTFLKGTANGHAIRVTTVDGPREVLIDGLTENFEGYQVSGNGPNPNVPVVVKVVNSHGAEKGCKVVTTDSTLPYTYTADFSGDPGAPSGGDNVYVSHANVNGDFLEIEVGVQNRQVYLPLIRENR